MPFVQDMKFRPTIFLSCLTVFNFITCGMLGLLFLLGGILGIKDGSMGIIFILFSLAFLILNWLLWKAFKDKIQFVSIDNEALSIFRPLSGKRIKFKMDSVKGYSKSLDDESIGTAIFNRNCLAIYFNNDLPPVEFVQYQLNDIKGFEEELNRLKVTFLGNEKINRDGFGKRTRFEFE